jgi:hypothetical protein
MILKPPMKNINKFIKMQINIIGILVLLGTQTASALTQNDFQCAEAGNFGGTCFYNPSDTCSGASITSLTPGTTSGTAAWNSNASQPYYLEELIINILQDLSQTLSVSQSDTVTQQHVIALVAWAQAEGGNIANSNAFNIWNMGFLSSYPKLYVGGGGAADGSSDSFVSFDAAVQAFTIEFTGANQSRIGAVLSNPSSTPEQVFNAIAYPSSTPGNQVWATASPTAYINSMEGGLSAANSDYAKLAGVVIGPGQKSTNHVPSSELQFSGGSSSSGGPISGVVGSTGSGSGCSTGTTSSVTCSDGSSTSSSGASDDGTSGSTTPTSTTAAILCEAELWNGVYYEFGGGHELSGYKEFADKCPDPSNPPDNQAHGGPSIDGGLSGNPSPCGVDCSTLVSFALDAALNQNYIWSVSSSAIMEGSGAQYWKQVPISGAQPGDIVTLVDATGHVEVVDHVSGGTIYTMGARETGTKDSVVSNPISMWKYAWKWTGPGSDGG